MEVNKEVSDHIKQLFQNGVSADSIKSAFLQKGWKEEVITPYINQVMGSISKDQKVELQNPSMNTTNTQDIGGDGISSKDLPGPVELLKQSWDIYKKSWKTLVGVFLIPYIMILVFVLVLGWVKMSDPPLLLVLAVYFVSISL
ncbi:hypothetical protein JXA63_00595, partial [Candidatus Woesebacteria bacterium]|nr:hypothetical protein [Candidatus Woesebacteria bacterium]